VRAAPGAASVQARADGFYSAEAKAAADAKAAAEPRLPPKSAVASLQLHLSNKTTAWKRSGSWTASGTRQPCSKSHATIDSGFASTTPKSLRTKITACKICDGQLQVRLLLPNPQKPAAAPVRALAQAAAEAKAAAKIRGCFIGIPGSRSPKPAERNDMHLSQVPDDPLVVTKEWWARRTF
jgi:hypothetical protein